MRFSDAAARMELSDCADMWCMRVSMSSNFKAASKGPALANKPRRWFGSQFQRQIDNHPVIATLDSESASRAPL